MNRRDAIKAAIGGAAACVLPAKQSKTCGDSPPPYKVIKVTTGVELVNGRDRRGKLTVWYRWKQDSRWHWAIAAQEC